MNTKRLSPHTPLGGLAVRHQNLSKSQRGPVWYFRPLSTNNEWSLNKKPNVRIGIRLGPWGRQGYPLPIIATPQPHTHSLVHNPRSPPCEAALGVERRQPSGSPCPVSIPVSIPSPSAVAALQLSVCLIGSVAGVPPKKKPPTHGACSGRNGACSGRNGVRGATGCLF